MQQTPLFQPVSTLGRPGLISSGHHLGKAAAISSHNHGRNRGPAGAAHADHTLAHRPGSRPGSPQFPFPPRRETRRESPFPDPVSRFGQGRETGPWFNGAPIGRKSGNRGMPFRVSTAGTIPGPRRSWAGCCLSLARESFKCRFKFRPPPHWHAF